MRPWKPLLAGVVAVWGGAALAQADADDILYLGPMAGYVFPDSKRDADGGINLQLLAGVRVARWLALEGHAFHTEFSRESDSSLHDYVYGGGLDLAVGARERGQLVFLLGGGALVQDLVTVETKDFFGNAGLGLYLPFGFGSELWRLEGRYQVIGNDHPALGADEIVEDVRANLGVLFPFGGGDDETAQSGEALAEPVADADGDGVPDALDQCPDTRGWVRADASGCVPDSDGDGVDEARDACPATPAGVAVDAAGCEVRAAAPPAIAALLDADQDGVADPADACPHTVPRFDVDEQGCVKPEEVKLGNVHFDLDSSRLTGDGYQLLRSLAATLQAHPQMRLEVGGHADASGLAPKNQALSRERAEVVRDFLTYVGVAGSRLTVAAYGASQPIGDNKTAEGRASNRRVEFRQLDHP